MTDHDVRTLTESEFRDAIDLFLATLHRPPVTDEHWPTTRKRYEPTRVFGAFIGGELAGTVMSLESALAIPGGAVLPASAVSGVGVRADRTRRGALTSLMRAQLAAVREHGDVVAMLHASEAMIYGRYGYGVATRGRAVSLRRRDVQLRDDAPRGGNVRLVDADTAGRLLPEVYRRIGLPRPGMMERSDSWWHTRLAMTSDVYAVHSDDDGTDDGFAMYKAQASDFHFGDGKCTLNVNDIQAADAVAAAELWRFVLDVDLVDEVVVIDRPLDEPVEWWVTDRRACRTTAVQDDLWVRLVDVPRALRERSFGVAEPVVLEVRDGLLPENSGTYRVAADGAQRCNAAAQLALDVDMLASLYLGDTTVSMLVAANRIDVRDPAAVSAAHKLFATSEVPWCGTGF